MANTTPVYGIPYLELADAPNLATGTQNLATEVETELIRIDAKPIIVAAACTTFIDLTTTEADVPGASVTFTTTKANARYMVTGSFYMAAIAGGSAVATGKLSVDGTNQAANANFTGISTNERANVSQSWIGTLAAAGSHTLKLRAVTSSVAAGSGTFRVNTVGTVLTVLVFEPGS